MQYCQRCVMPDTRPGSIFNEDGICQACKNYEKFINTDWDSRYKELISLCDKYRREDGQYDCIIAVSGGKDSHFITYIMKEKMGMNPLLISVADPFTHTDAGKQNFRNIGETFGCDILQYVMNPELFRRVTKIGFEELGEPLRFIEAAIYTVPQKYAVAFDIPLVVYGENSAFTYGTTTEDGFSAKKYIDAGHSASGEKLGNSITDFWLERGITPKDLNSIIPSSPEKINQVKPEPIFLSYFVPWDDENNLNIAKKYGFRDLTHEWKREGFIDDYGQIDSIAYILHLWLKYPKFGFARSTDIASRWIRKSKITREEAIKLVMENDHLLDQRALEDFVTFMGYSPIQFWEIVEKFWNPDLFDKVNSAWRLKNTINNLVEKV